MIFSPELVDKILAGEKTVTRLRLTTGPCEVRYQVGKTYAVQAGRGKPHVGHIRVLSVSREPLSRITDLELRNEGFSVEHGRDCWAPLRVDFEDYWRKVNGSYDPDETVAVIRFELAPRCDDCHFW